MEDIKMPRLSGLLSLSLYGVQTEPDSPLCETGFTPLLKMVNKAAVVFPLLTAGNPWICVQCPNLFPHNVSAPPR